MSHHVVPRQVSCVRAFLLYCFLRIIVTSFIIAGGIENTLEESVLTIRGSSVDLLMTFGRIDTINGSKLNLARVIHQTSGLAANIGNERIIVSLVRSN